MWTPIIITCGIKCGAVPPRDPRILLGNTTTDGHQFNNSTVEVWNHWTWMWSQSSLKPSVLTERFWKPGLVPMTLVTCCIQHRRIWTSPSPFLYNQRICCHEDTDPVREARLLRLRSKYLEPDSSPCQEPSFCSGFSQSSKDLFVFRNNLDTVMHYQSHCCRYGTTAFMIIMIMIMY